MVSEGQRYAFAEDPEQGPGPGAAPTHEARRTASTPPCRSMSLASLQLRHLTTHHAVHQLAAVAAVHLDRQAQLLADRLQGAVNQVLQCRDVALQRDVRYWRTVFRRYQLWTRQSEHECDGTLCCGTRCAIECAI